MIPVLTENFKRKLLDGKAMIENGTVNLDTIKISLNQHTNTLEITFSGSMGDVVCFETYPLDFKHGDTLTLSNLNITYPVTVT